MCVILAIEGSTKPDLDMLQKCGKCNDDGAGIAYIKEKSVVWKKGLTAQDIYAAQEQAEAPYLIHFRLATTGGVSDGLTHPFPITRKVGLDVAGKLPKGKLLMHNGIWQDGEWKDAVRHTMFVKNVHFPKGPWSDSRAMAWLAYHWGDSILETFPGKLALLSVHGVEYFGDGWTERGDTGIFCSNKSWEYASFGHNSGYYNNRWNQGDVWDNCTGHCETCPVDDCEYYQGYTEPVSDDTPEPWSDRDCLNCIAPIEACRDCSRDGSNYQPNPATVGRSDSPKKRVMVIDATTTKKGM